MTYFADLTPCTYFDDPQPDPEDPLTPPLTAVGWRDAPHAFALGDPGNEVFQRLKELRAMHWMPNLFLGGHRCSLCRYSEFCSQKHLFIPGETGVTYAVPEGIVHYVGCPGYLPPQEFCEALLRCPPADTPEFFAALRANGWPEEFTQPEPPMMSHPTTVALRAALTARGWALAAGLEAIFARSGAYPATLEPAEGVAADAEWTYEAETEGGGYVLRAELEIEGTLLAFDSRINGCDLPPSIRDGLE